MDGESGATLGTAQIDHSYRLQRGKLRALLCEGLEIRWGKTVSAVRYSDDKQTVTAELNDGTCATGTLLVGADGTRSKIREVLLGPEKAKTTPVDYAFTMCYSKHTRERALWLRSAPYHPRTWSGLNPWLTKS